MSKLKILCTTALFLIPSYVYADGLTNSAVINTQYQQQFGGSIPIPGGTMDINVVTQDQKGLGTSMLNSYAYDVQEQGSSALGTDTVSGAGGIAVNGGTYAYLNNQASITMDVNSDVYGSAVGVGAAQAAFAFADGNAVSVAGGYVSHGDWYTSNQANSFDKPVAINAGGMVEVNMETPGFDNSFHPSPVYLGPPVNADQ